jgi:hypothetical protein
LKEVEASYPMPSRSFSKKETYKLVKPWPWRKNSSL